MRKEIATDTTRLRLSSSPKNGLLLDQDHDILVKLRGRTLKSYAEKLVPPLQLAKQQIGGVCQNVRLFLAREFHMDSGLRCLIESFYRSIREDSAVPIPYREILRTARIMDSIFAQLSSNRQGQSVLRELSVGTAATNVSVES